MSAIRFFTDEDVFRALAASLRAWGYDAVSTPELSRRGELDESHLEWATEHERTLVSFNIKDFTVLHKKWLTQSRRHCGIIVSKQLPVGELLRRLLVFAQANEAEQMVDRFEFLSAS